MSEKNIGIAEDGEEEEPVQRSTEPLHTQQFVDTPTLSASGTAPQALKGLTDGSSQLHMMPSNQSYLHPQVIPLNEPSPPQHTLSQASPQVYTMPLSQSPQEHMLPLSQSQQHTTPLSQSSEENMMALSQSYQQHTMSHSHLSSQRDAVNYDHGATQQIPRDHSQGSHQQLPKSSSQGAQQGVPFTASHQSLHTPPTPTTPQPMRLREPPAHHNIFPSGRRIIIPHRNEPASDLRSDPSTSNLQTTLNSSPATPTTLRDIFNSSAPGTPDSASKRKRKNTCDPEAIMMACAQRLSQKENRVSDEFTCYGQHLSSQLRSLNPTQRNTAYRLMDTIIHLARSNILDVHAKVVNGPNDVQLPDRI